MVTVANTPWNDERDTLLAKLWVETTLSTREIALEIVKETGGNITKNSVISRARRLFLPKKKPNSPHPRNDGAEPRKAIRRVRRSPIRIAPMVVEEPKQVNGGIRLLELQNDTCREVIGTSPLDGFAVFCEAKRTTRIASNGDVVWHGSYCPFHSRKNYRSS